ncbi:putative ribonuclease H-like domain-containing protein [Tanacetum coccineum]
MCDKKNSVLFTDTKCVVLSPDFKLLDENHVLLRVPRKDNMYNVDLKNIVSFRMSILVSCKGTQCESNLWHRRLRHINFKTMNKLVRGNLVRGLPLKIFENNHTCVACQKGKQHKASCKSRLINFSSPKKLVGNLNASSSREMLDDFDRQDVKDLHRLVLLMNTIVAIHMMIEKKYPLTQEMLSRMLNRRLEVDYESEMAFELIRFTKSQLQK